MGYRCKHFIVQELVGPQVYKDRGEAAWDLLCPKLLITLDTLRNKYGAVKINDWHMGGQFHESGLRDFSTATGAAYSMHKLARAADLKFASVTPEEVQRYVMDRPEEFPLLTCMESAADTKTWLHCDTRNHNSDAQIIIVKP